MTEFENHEPESEMWIYMTNLPIDYEESDLDVIFNGISNDQLVIKEVRFVPYFQDPYHSKCAYILFYNWDTYSIQVSAIESCFLNRTFYTYQINKGRTWLEYIKGENPISRSCKIYYSKKGLSRKVCARKWDLIKTHFQRIEKNENIINDLFTKINRLEEKIIQLESRIGFSEEGSYIDL